VDKNAEIKGGITMASVTKIKGKRGVSYKITVSNGYDANGKRIRETATYRPNPLLGARENKSELEKFAYEFEQKVKHGVCIRGDKITLREFVAKWLDDYANNQLEPTTLSSYRNYLEKHIIPELGSYKLSEITPLLLQNFYNSLLCDGVRANGKRGGYSPATVRKYHAIISSLMSAAYKWQLIDHNPCNRVKPPKMAYDISTKCFTLEETEIFLKLINGLDISEQLRLFYYMALYGGFRRGELIALTWDKVDYKNNIIVVDRAAGCVGKTAYMKAPKTRGSVRDVALPADVMGMIRHYQERQNPHSDFIFIKHDGTQMHLSTPSHHFHKMLVHHNQTADLAHKLPVIALHGLRHTHATLLIYANTDIKTVSARLGHSQASTTLNIYAHNLKKADAACAVTIDNLLNEK
jgi:integrase